MTTGLRHTDVPAACAIVTRDYLSYARILAESYLAQYPRGRFYLLALDGLPPGVDAGLGISLIAPDDLGCPWFWEMVCRYDRFQLSCALKPFLVTALFESGEKTVFYFDSDIVVYRRLEEAERSLQDADMLLTPHILHPIERDGLQPDELYILSGGVYNMGFFGIRNSAESLRILSWWSSRLRDLCGRDLAAGMYLDQRWADLMPAVFPSVALLRDASYNVAFWNLQERHLEEASSGITVDGRPLTFFHFSGADLDAGVFRSTAQTRQTVRPGTPMHTLMTNYIGLHERHGRRECLGWESPFERFDNGLRFHPLFRQLYLALDEPRRAAFGNPFATGSVTSFFEWALRSDADGLSPLLRQLHAATTARQQFPVLTPDVRTEFMAWAKSDGAVELELEPGLASRLVFA